MDNIEKCSNNTSCYYYPVPGPQGFDGFPGCQGPPGIGLCMEYATVKSTIVLPVNVRTTVKMQRIIECQVWALFEQAALGLVEEGNYQWDITIQPLDNGPYNGYVLSTQVYSLIVDACNPCILKKCPVMGTVQPFIQDKCKVFTTTGHVRLCNPRYEIVLELLDFSSPVQEKSVTLEVTIVVGKVVPMPTPCDSYC